jgi:hypothetical protein
MIILIINIIKYIIKISYSLNFVEPADTLVKQPETCYSSKSTYQKLDNKQFHNFLLFIICNFIYRISYTIIRIRYRYSAMNNAKCVPEKTFL